MPRFTSSHSALFDRIMAQPALGNMDLVSPLHVLAGCDGCECIRSLTSHIDGSAAAIQRFRVTSD